MEIVLQENAKRKSSFNKIAIGCSVVIGIFILLIIIISIATCSNNKTSKPSINQPVYTGPEVVYEVTGTTPRVSITMSNGTGGTEQYDDAHIPVRIEFEKFPGRFLYISAQNKTGAGDITTSIYLKGELYKSATSSGAYVIATASGYK
jgi:hypothetical protein